MGSRAVIAAAACGQAPPPAQVEAPDSLDAAPGASLPMAAGALNAFESAHVIESAQADDGAGIDDLFAEGRPGTPSMEVHVVKGGAEPMIAVNPH